MYLSTKIPPAEAQTLLQTAFSQVAISQDAYTFILIGTCAVEMRGVEPLSENIAIQLSPSADDIFYFASQMPIDGRSSRYSVEFP